MEQEQQKRYRAWAEIDLNALTHNVQTVQNRLPAQTQFMAVVKANAYGHGDAAICQKLWELGVRWFAVSNLEEALSVRQLCPYGEIFILGYTPPEFAPELARNNIIQGVLSLEYARQLQSFAHQPVRCHIKLDSGMNRLGFDTHEAAAGETVREICAIAALPGIRIDGVFSHFACADEEDVGMTDMQFARYRRVVDACEAAGVHFAKKHICNSAGALRFPAMYQDFVRLGIVLYGLSPSAAAADPALIPVMRLKSRIAHIHTVHAGDCISYGAEFRASGEMRVATIPIGYADGFIRAYKNGGTVMVGGRAAKLLGRVCMDQCMVDVTGLDAAVGDFVYIFDASGENIERLCRAADTINYEALCLVSKRVPRVAVNG